MPERQDEYFFLSSLHWKLYGFDPPEPANLKVAVRFLELIVALLILVCGAFFACGCGGIGIRLNVAVTVVSAFAVSAHEPEPEQPPPDQPAKREPDAGAAVRVTPVPELKAWTQVLPQLIPAGELVTVPLPAPDLLTLRKRVVVIVPKLDESAVSAV